MLKEWEVYQQYNVSILVITFQTTLIDKEYERHSFLTLNLSNIGIYFHQNY